jgi:hypothetical protein
VTGEHTSGRGECPFQLNVVFHGLWAFETMRGGILAHTVKDHQHVITAGDHDVRMYDLEPGRNYKLDVKPQTGHDVDFDLKQNIVVSDKPLRDSRKRFCTVWLPPANLIQSERRVLVSEKAFAGADGSQLDPCAVSMVQVFIYEEITCARLKRHRWEYKVDEKTKSADLHIHAEPAEKVDCFHPVRAYKRLAEMFGLEIIPIRELFVEASKPQPPITGLDVEDMKSLHEGVAMLGGSGSNCDSLVIHNHPKL